MVDTLLTSSDLHPVLVDVGASGGAPACWRPIARHATYLCFDPDARDRVTRDDRRFRRTVRVDRIVAATAADTTQLYLTANPHCSSTLVPATVALADYTFADRFRVVGTQQVASVTLAQACADAGLATIDWLKLDTQGTDLRIFASLPPALQHSVLALDCEPGLIAAYTGEDDFASTHSAVLRAGFWPIKLEVLGAVRACSLVSAGRAVAERTFPTSPAWVEARYLRSLASLAAHDADRRSYLLLWLFALLNDQVGFAHDCAVVCARRFGSDRDSLALDRLTRARVRGYTARLPLVLLRRALGRVWQRLAD